MPASASGNTVDGLTLRQIVEQSLASKSVRRMIQEEVERIIKAMLSGEKPRKKMPPRSQWKTKKKQDQPQVTMSEPVSETL